MALSSLDFKRRLTELKAKVGVIDVALVLGYRVKEAAGKVGRSKWVEMVKGDGANVSDVIIVGSTNSHDRSRQVFFRRNGGGVADVCSLIRENLGSFNGGNGSEWQQVMNVLSDMANMPRPEVISVYKEIQAESRVSRQFDESQYQVKDVNYDQMHRLFGERGLDKVTANVFAPFVKAIRDVRNTKFTGYNLGFPYTIPGNDHIEGYEIRGAKGFKGKATGSNSSTAAWIADFAQRNGLPPKNVYFFESAFDAMAFYQRNNASLDIRSSVFISTGGAMGTLQIKGLLNHYYGSNIVDCFDRDAAGRVYACNMALIKAGISGEVLKASADSPGCNVTIGDTTKFLPLEEANGAGIKKHFGINTDVDCQMAPEGYKDWNDVVLGERQGGIISHSKYARNENLARRRSSSLHM